jgi:hypothetical protein
MNFHLCLYLSNNKMWKIQMKIVDVKFHGQVLAKKWNDKGQTEFWLLAKPKAILYSVSFSAQVWLLFPFRKRHKAKNEAVLNSKHNKCSSANTVLYMAELIKWLSGQLSTQPTSKRLLGGSPRLQLCCCCGHEIFI